MNVIDHIFSEFVDYSVRPMKEEAEYKAVEKSFYDLSDHFMDTLTREQRDIVFKIEAQRNLLGALDEKQMFCYGFRIGVELILEVLFFKNQENKK